jgi:hypothetical protein
LDFRFRAGSRRKLVTKLLHDRPQRNHDRKSINRLFGKFRPILDAALRQIDQEFSALKDRPRRAITKFEKRVRDGGEQTDLHTKLAGQGPDDRNQTTFSFSFGAALVHVDGAKRDKATRLVADHSPGTALTFQAVAHSDAGWFAFNRELKLPAAAGGASCIHESGSAW